MGFVHIDHIGLVVQSIEQARQVLGDAVGLDLDEARSNWPDGSYFPPEQTYNYFFQVGDGETQVEVLVPEEGATSGAARFLERRGPGLHHLCYACTDVHDEAERLVANGLQEIELPRGAGRRRSSIPVAPAGCSPSWYRFAGRCSTTCRPCTVTATSCTDMRERRPPERRTAGRWGRPAQVRTAAP